MFQLCCHGHSLLLSSYLCRIKRKNSSCSTCGHPLQDLPHLLDCPASEPLWHTIFDTYFFYFRPLGQTVWAWPNCWAPVSMKFLYTPISGKGLGSTTTTIMLTIILFLDSQRLKQFQPRMAIASKTFCDNCYAS